MAQSNNQTNRTFSCCIAGNQALSNLDNSKNHHKVVLFFQKMYIAVSLTNKLGVMSLSIGSTFKEKATQSIKGMAIATTMFTAFPHAANASGAGEAAANDHPGTPTIEKTSLSRAQQIAHAADQINVPLSDQRDMRKEVVRTIAARSSRDGITVAVYGSDKNLFNEAKLAVYDAYQQGIPVHGIVVGSLSDERDYDVYADGILVTKDKGLTVEEMLAYNHNEKNIIDIQKVISGSIDFAHEKLQEFTQEKRRDIAAVKPASFDNE